MSYREVNQVIEGAPNVIVREVRGRFEVRVEYWRDLRSGNSEDVKLVFCDVDYWDLQCVARGMHQALAELESKLEDTREALRGEG